MTATTTVSDALVRWLAGGRRGVSSNTIVQHLTGLPAANGWGMSHPYDVDDFRLCVELLRACPELAARMDEMKSVSPVWARLVEGWSEIEALLPNPAEDAWIRQKQRDQANRRIRDLVEGRMT